MISKYLSPNDLIKTDKKTLSQIANELGAIETGTNTEIVGNIWKMRGNKNFETVMKNHQENLFSHRGSYITYKLVNGDLDKFTENYINEYLNRKVEIETEDITNTPTILSAYELSDSEILLKVTFRERFETRIYNEEVIKSPVIVQNNLLIDKANNLLEVRSNYDISKQIIKFINSLDDNLRFVIPNIKKDKIKDELNATLISSVGYTKNEQVVLNDNGKDAIENIITFIDNCLENDVEQYDINHLKDQIDVLKGEEEINNFVLLLLSGLGKLDLSSIFNSSNQEDLTQNSLYQMVEPFLEANSMFLTVPFNNKGVIENFTIKVGFEKNVITFVSMPTEAFVRHVRSKII
ncbi:hypothetical protein [Staphylococcus pseudoxylosus]|uniref:hypothetical protein n=1 Tax=Staphylococcus pseudoxylosus TaxID=2282419 RepID=UPI003F5777B7